MNETVADQVRLTEIFLSLQGESTSAGLPTVFVRLTGCPLRCAYCDTAYAFHGGTMTATADIVERVRELGVAYVTVTGGEPLAQPGALPLLQTLCDAGFSVSLETSGALDISRVDERVRTVLDIKTPGSGESGRNLWSNLDHLKPGDEIKFVICDRQDYDWARLKADELSLWSRDVEVLLSPSAGQQNATELAEWIIADRLPARLQLQMHKLLWGDEPGR